MSEASAHVRGIKLSPLQMRQWEVGSADPRRAASGAILLEGPVSRDALRHEVQRLVAEHEILRTTFRRVAGARHPVQVVSRRAELDWVEVDGRGSLAGEELGLGAMQTFPEPGDFDLARGPTLRAVFVDLGASRSALHLSVPSVCGDSTSIRLLLEAIETSLQSADSRRTRPVAAPDTVQYADFSEWHNELLDDPAAEGALRFWRDCVAHLPPPGTIPQGVGSSPGTFEPREIEARLDEHISSRLVSIAESLESTLENVLYAAWHTLISRLTCRRALSTGVRTDGRDRPELEGSIGPYSRWVPLHCPILRDDTLGDVVRRIDRARGDASRWQEFFLADGGGHDEPVQFAVGFAFDALPAPRRIGEALRAKTLYLRDSIEPYRVMLGCTAGEHGLMLHLRYDSSTFPRQDADRLLGQLLRILDQIVGHPSRRVSDLSLLAPEEWEQLVDSFNDTDSAYPEVAVHDLFRAQARLKPDAIALSFLDSAMSYAELDRRSDAVASALHEKGVHIEDLVGIVAERTPHTLVALLGVLKAGAAYVPLDPTHPEERIELVLRESGVAALLAESRAAVPWRLSRPPPILEIDGICHEAEAAPASTSGGPLPDNLAYVIYTSGSTAIPKGVAVTHRAVVNYLTFARDAYRIADGSGAPVHSPLGFDLTVTSLLGGLVSGTTAVLIPEGDELASLAEAMHPGREFSIAKVTPAHLAGLAERLGDADLEGRTAVFVVGGETLGRAAVEAWRKRAPRTRIVNEYGPTETTVGCCVSEVDLATEGRLAIGRPIANTRTYVLDPQGAPTPIGVVGEIHVGGVGVARGYLGKPGLTAERFLPDPFGNGAGARMYRTGDLGRHRSDGEIDCLGRTDTQVKLMGFRIELEEIEVQLARHPALSAAAVTADLDAGRLTAFVVTGTGAERPSAEVLRRFMARALPWYMVPTSFVQLNALPITANGKVDRSALASHDSTTPLFDRPTPPDSPMQRTLAEIWACELGLEPSRIGIHDSFFALGGDSILSVRVVAAARERGIDVSVRQLFRYPTISELVAALDGPEPSLRTVETRAFDLISSDDRRLLPSGVEDAYPMGMVQLGMLYHMVATPTSHVPPAYHNANTMHLRLRFEIDAFREAVRRATRRHPILRTSFDLTSFSEPMQLVHANVEPFVDYHDLRERCEAEQHLVLQEFRANQNARAVDLSRPPLIHFFVHQVADDRIKLTLAEPHSISDGWSTHLTLVEIFEEMLAIQDHEPLEPPRLSVTYRDFIALERDAIASPETRRFWKSALEGAHPTRLPRARWSLGPRTRHETHKHYHPFDESTTSSLMQLAARLGVPLKSVLLAAHLKVVGVLTGEDHLFTGMTFNGRPEVTDGDRVRGLFLNTLPVHFTLGGKTLAELIREAFERETEVLPHRRFPLGALQEIWGPEPLIDVAFGYLHFHSLTKSIEQKRIEFVEPIEDASTTHFPLMVTYRLSATPPYVLTLLLQRDLAELSSSQMQTIYSLTCRVLKAMARDPETNDASLFTDEELRLMTEPPAVGDLDQEFAL